MIHLFKVEEAKEFGVDCAIIISRMRDLRSFYKANHPDQGYRDSFSLKQLREHMPYFSPKQLRTKISYLLNLGVVELAEDNDNHPMDKTKWYRLNERW